MNEATTQRSRLGTVTVAAAAVVLFLLVLVHSLADCLARSFPSAALLLQSNNELALSQLNDADLREALAGLDAASLEDEQLDRLTGLALLPPREGQDTPKPRGAAPIAQQMTDAIMSRSHTALLANPLSGHALTQLAMIQARNGDANHANENIQAAVRRSLHERAAVYWMMRLSIDAGNYRDAASYADALLRWAPDSADSVLPYLARMAETDGGTAPLKDLLSGNPPWRQTFFEKLRGNIRSPKAPLLLLLALKDTAKPPAFSELSSYINLLIDNDLYDLAYDTWLQFLPSEHLAKAGYVFNGNFDFPISGYPFDWTMKSGAGVIVDLPADDTKANRHLAVSFTSGRADFHPVRQMVLLIPGDYTLSGRYRSELKARRGLKWVVSCAGRQPVELAQSSEINGTTQGWTDFQLTFKVPAEGCRAQWLALTLDARSTSETLISGTFALDDVAISRGPVTAQ